MDIKEQIQQYFTLNEQVKTLEKQLKELRPFIESFIAQEAAVIKLTESVTVKIDNFVATLAPASRENFNLKQAKVELNPEMLKPFISVSNYTTLKVNKLA